MNADLLSSHRTVFGTCWPTSPIRIAAAPEEVKAWSQNLGHESPLTTFTSYGTIATDRQGELVRSAHLKDPTTDILAQIRSLVT